MLCYVNTRLTHAVYNRLPNFSFPSPPFGSRFFFCLPERLSRCPIRVLSMSAGHPPYPHCLRLIGWPISPVGALTGVNAERMPRRKLESGCIGAMRIRGLSEGRPSLNALVSHPASWPEIRFSEGASRWNALIDEGDTGKKKTGTRIRRGGRRYYHQRRRRGKNCITLAGIIHKN